MPPHGPGVAKGRALARAHGRPRIDLGPPQAPEKSTAPYSTLANAQSVRLPLLETATAAGTSRTERACMGRGLVSTAEAR